MILMLAIALVVLALPLLLMIAVTLGPVILGILCAVGCALVVFFLGNVVIALGFLARFLERAGMRLVHRQPAH